jgi:predicted AlkP superfamily pyrophosphatase or phosphodiesterase
MTVQASLCPDRPFGRQGRFRRPAYDSYCFSRIPATIERLLGQEPTGVPLPEPVLGGLPGEYDTVVLLFIDAFGWAFWDRFADQMDLLKVIAREGVATRLTSQFPSTTAAHITCIHSGQAVAQSGVYEWTYYDPGVGAMISPLPFTFAGDPRREALATAGITPDRVLPPGSTLYDRFTARGVDSFVFQKSSYVHSTCSEYLCRGVTQLLGYDTLPEALTLLADHLISTGASKRYYFLYVDSLDHHGHKHGPHSDCFAAELDSILMAAERYLVNRVRGKVKNTLLFVTADHGQVRTDLNPPVYVNEAIPELTRWLQTAPDGSLIKFGGSPRDLFLYVRPEYLTEAAGRLSTLLEGKAEVWPVEDLIREGLFGPEISQRFRDRVGNLAVLPYEEYTVFWHEGDKFKFDKRGHHGGLMPAEMDTGAYLLPLG